jgi:hypothetical protein
VPLSLHVTQDLGFSGLVQRTAPFRRLVGPGREMPWTYSHPDTHGSPLNRLLRHGDADDLF